MEGKIIRFTWQDSGEGCAKSGWMESLECGVRKVCGSQAGRVGPGKSIEVSCSTGKSGQARPGHRM